MRRNLSLWLPAISNPMSRASTSPWSVKNGYSYAPEEGGNWMIYDFADYPEEALNHDGTRAALLMMAAAGDGDDLTTYHQDEWLIARPGAGAVYMDFWYFLYPELREVGAYPDFPDHYYVMISRDNGETWSELWDGRWDMGPGEGVQQASIFLGEPTDENTLVAFNAVSGEEESLYYLWAVDDVNFYTAEEAAKRSVKLTAPADLRSIASAGNLPLYRKFETSDKSARVARRAPESEWLNGGNITYRVYLDGEMIADYLKARYFTDYSTKQPGKHEYKVMAWSEAKDHEYASASVSVDIDEYTFAPVRNVTATYTAQDNGKYTILASWEAPDNEMQPDHYDVYVNGKSIGWVVEEDRLELGQSGVFKGAYTFDVVACYKFPDGEATPVSASVFPGTVPTPLNLTLSNSGNDVEIAWEAPDAAGNAPASYRVYRGTELISEGASLAYTDRAVADGKYYYSVHAVYADGEESLPVSESIILGAPSAMTLPYSQNFDTGHIPAGWDVELNDPHASVKEMYAWRFDNWFDTDYSAESALKGNFASVSGLAAGMNLLETYLVSPPFSIPADIHAAISFDKYYFEEKPGPSGSAQFVLQTSLDNGINWSEEKNLVEEPAGKCTVDLKGFAGQTIMFRWAFMSRNSGVAAVDNVLVYDTVGVDNIADTAIEVVDVYTAAGLVVARGITMDNVKNLPAGLYILRNGNRAEKRVIR